MLELSYTLPVLFWLAETDTNYALSNELASGLLYEVPPSASVKLLREVVQELLLKKYRFSMYVLLSYKNICSFPYTESPAVEVKSKSMQEDISDEV